MIADAFVFLFSVFMVAAIVIGFSADMGWIPV